MEEVAILQPDVVLCLGIVEEIAYCACLGVEEGKGRDARPSCELAKAWKFSEPSKV